MKVIIDRFEGNFAVVELGNEKLANLPKALLPDGAGEGSVISIELDVGETELRRQKIRDISSKIKRI